MRTVALTGGDPTAHSQLQMATTPSSVSLMPDDGTESIVVLSGRQARGCRGAVLGGRRTGGGLRAARRAEVRGRSEGPPAESA